MKSQLTEKDPDAGKDKKQKEKGMTEDEMDMSLSKLQEFREAWCTAVHGVTKNRT